MENQGSTTTNKNVLIFMVVAVILGLMLVFIIARSQISSPRQEVATKEALSEVPIHMTVMLDPLNGSKEDGVAQLVSEGGKTRVFLTINNPPRNIPQPAHIHVGSCPGVGEIKYPLSDVVEGHSETLINASLNDLKQQLPLAVNVHKSSSEAKTYVSCAQLE